MSIPLLIFLTAFSLRYFHIASSTTRHDFFSYFWLVDSSPYLSYAAKILHGEVFLPWQSPFPSYLLAGLFYFTGVDHFLGKILFAVIGSAACVLVYFLAIELFTDQRVAIATGFMGAASFGLIMATGAYNSEVIHGTLLVVVIYLSLRMIRGSPTNLAFAVGGLSGLALLNRGEYVLFLPFLFGWLLFSLGKRNGLKVCSLIVVICSIIIAPNIYRNYEYFHSANERLGKEVFPEIYFLAPYSEFVFSQSNSPLNSVRSSGRLYGSNQEPQEWRIRILSNPLHRKLFLQGRQLGIDYILSDISGFLSLAGSRMRVLLEVFALGFLGTNSPAGLSGRNGKADCFTPDNQILLMINLPLFILGIWRSFRQNVQPHLLIAGCFTATLVANTFYFGLTRYGIYLLPLLFLYVAIGALFLWDRGINEIFVTRQWLDFSWGREKLTMCISVIIGLLLVGGSQALGDKKVNPARDFFLGAVQSARAQKTDEAIARFESGFSVLQNRNNIIRDEMVLARFSFKLAELYHRKNKPQKTLEELRRTLLYDPWHPRALFNMGILYGRLGDKAKTVAAFERLGRGFPNYPKLSEMKTHLRVSAQTGSRSVLGNSFSLMWGPDL